MDSGEMSQLSEEDQRRLQSQAYSLTIKSMLEAFREIMHDREMMGNLPPGKYPYARQLSGREIRLLKMQSRTSDDELSFELLERPLDTNIKFTALSYTWGDINPTRTITCDNHPLEITPNLFSALKELFEPDDLIWVDAICINQHDQDEKTHQVRMMKDIYAQARLTAVWLGEEQDGDFIGAELLHDFYRVYFRDDLVFGKDLDVTEEGFPDPETPDGMELWSPVWSLYSRRWFSRVWVLQEVFASSNCTFNWGPVKLPSEVVLGAAMTAMKYRNLVFSWAHFERERQQIQAPVIHATKMAYLWQVLKQHGSLNLQTILEITKAFQATDERDKVFALVGLSSNADPEFISYGKGLDTIFLQIARNALASPGSGEHDYLSHISKQSAEKAGVPSWVPALPYDEPDFNPLSGAFQGSDMAPNSELELYFGSGSVEALYLQGKIFDEVQSMVSDAAPYIGSDVMTQTISTMQKTKEWLSQCEELLSGRSEYPTGGTVAEAFWRTLMFDTVYPGERVTDDDVKSYNAFRELVSLFNEPDPATTLPLYQQSLSNESRREAILQRRPEEGLFELATESQRFEQAFSRFLAGRRFCISRRGYIGWVHSVCQPGDQICVFEGCRVLFAIRPQGDGYELLGDCYLHGLMDGGAMELPWAEMKEIKLV